MTSSSPITLLFTGLPARADKFLTGISTVALVRLNGRTLLFDTGPYAYRPILQMRLKKLGIDPGEIDTVVLSHVHWDTAANADLFPNAEIVLHEKELAYAETPAMHDADTPGYIGRALRRLRLRPVTGEQDIAAGVRIVELPGHSPGSIGALVGHALLAGDAVTCAGDAAASDIRSDRADHEQARESLSRALTLAEVIYPGHDRPFRMGPPITYLDDYAIRIRFFTDPAGPDEEIQIGSFAAKSFASWP
jgi:glyoxylase-like metal-dependent hydrolase (beta-lactamase superfamily II)